MISPNLIRKGHIIDYSNSPWVVIKATHRTQGRQSGFVQVVIKSLDSDLVSNHKYRSGENIKTYDVEIKKLNYLYNDGRGFNFIQEDSCEDFTLSKKIIEPCKYYIASNNTYETIFIDNRARKIQLPDSVTMQVVSSPEYIKGNTANSTHKPVTLESGLVVQVPLFVKKNNFLKIDTSDGSYLCRVVR